MVMYNVLLFNTSAEDAHIHSLESDLAKSVQVVRRSGGCGGALQFADAGTGFRLVFVQGERGESVEGRAEVSALLKADGESAFVNVLCSFEPDYAFMYQVSFARSRSDAVVRTLDPQSYDRHKAARDERKSTMRAPVSSLLPPSKRMSTFSSSTEGTRYTNPLKQKLKAKRMSEFSDVFQSFMER
jgi:hypothetical protein